MNGLRSQISEPLRLRFFNKCDKTVDIIWIGLSGQYHVYCSLKPKNYLDVNTYTRHYWVFRETESQNQLVANNKWHFCGEESGYLPYKSNTPMRHIVFISRHVVNKLRTICIDYLCHGKNALKRCSDVKYLEIPVTLKKVIIEKIHRRDPDSHSTPDDKEQCKNNLILWPD